MERTTLTVAEMAVKLGISKPLAYNLIHQQDGGIPHIRIGRRIVIPAEMFGKWLTEQAGSWHKG